MKFFERFKLKSKEIKTKNELIEGEREYSLDDARLELNKELKTKEIITGEDPLEPNEEEYQKIKTVSELRMSDAQILKDNIRLLMTEIAANNRKIKQLEDSKKETERAEASGDRPVIPANRYKEMIISLEKINDEKELLIKAEEEKIRDLYNQN
jgi:hypothetical protein